MFEEHQRTLEACRFCWMCRHVCPAGRATHLETTTPRGWALQLWYVQQGRLPLEGRTVDALYHCLQCGLCEAWCVPGFAPHRLIRDARAEAVRLGVEIPAVDEAYQNLERYGNAYGRPEPRPEEYPVAGDVLYLQGCAGASLVPDHQERALRLFRKAGVRVALPVQYHCCGGLAYELGLDETARELALRTAADIERSQARTVVVAGDTCRRTMAEVYPKLGVSLPGASIVSPARFLRDLLQENRIRLSEKASVARVALQDPTRPASPREYDELREVLAFVPGLELVEMPHNQRERAQSCGDGGGVLLTHREVARAQAIQQLEAARQAGAQALVASSPSCLYALRAAKDAVPGVEVLDLLQVVEQAALP